MSSRQYTNITCVQFFNSTTNYSVIVQALFRQVKASGRNCQIRKLTEYSAESYTTPQKVAWFDDYRNYDNYKGHFKSNRTIWTKAFTKDDHQKLMNLFKILTELFSKHKIEYMLTEGSLMGSMRHFDQIPWVRWQNHCWFFDVFLVIIFNFSILQSRTMTRTFWSTMRIVKSCRRLLKSRQYRTIWICTSWTRSGSKSFTTALNLQENTRGNIPLLTCFFTRRTLRTLNESFETLQSTRQKLTFFRLPYVPTASIGFQRLKIPWITFSASTTRVFRRIVIGALGTIDSRSACVQAIFHASVSSTFIRLRNRSQSRLI